MANENNRALVYDLRQYSADEKVRRNILGVRTAVSRDSAYVDQGSFVIKAGKTLTLNNLPQCLAITIYAKYPVFISGAVDGNATPTSFTGQTLFNLTTGMNDVSITNNNVEDVSVTVIRFSASEAEFVISRRLITFAPLSRIAPIGASVTNIANVVVEDVALFQLINDQVIAPSNSAGQRFRVCNADGTPNVNGAYIMYLNDIVTQQNFSGTLQLWVSERN